MGTKAKSEQRGEFVSWAMIIAGVLVATFGLKSFLLPHKLVDGGIIGISLLITTTANWPLSLLLLVLNTPFYLLSSVQVNSKFAAKSLIAVVFLAIAVTFLEFPTLTSDIWLVTVFGGFFVGAGMGLAIRGGANIDGTEILALYISRRSSLSLSDVHLLINILFFSIVAYFLNLDTAFYSILTYITTSKTIEYIIEGIDEYIGITIVSIKHEEITQMIIERLGRGVTLYDGKMGYGKRGAVIRHTEIIYTIITRLELYKLQTEIKQIDPDAFVVMNPVKDTKGGMIKKRPLKKDA